VQSTKASAKTVLVIEDEAIIAEVCTRILRAEGFKVRVVPDGEAALDLLNEEGFAFVLVDIRMPRMNGIEFYRHLERMYPKMVDRVVFTTGDILSSDIKRFLDEAECPYLAKPFTPDELKGIAKDILDGKDRTNSERSENVG